MNVINSFEEHSLSQNSNQVEKGLLLEYRIKRLLFHMGYFPQNNIVIKTTSQESNDIITDLDVYGIQFHSDFSYATTWVDCKSGKANVLQHIEWINGIKNIIKVDNVIFIKPGVRKSTKEYARTLGIKIFDLEMLEHLEESFNIAHDDWKGMYDYTTQSQQLSGLSRIVIPNNHSFKKIAEFISSDYWTFDNFTQVKKCLTGIKQLSEYLNIPLDPKQIQSIKWGVYSLISLFLLSTLKICSEIYYYSDKDKYEILHDGLVSGTIPIHKRKEIVDASYQIAAGVIKQYIPDFDTSTFHKINPFNPPLYFKAYYDLVLRIVSQPTNWNQSLRYLNFILMEYDLKSIQYCENDLTNILPDTQIYSIKTIMHFICSTTGLSRNNFLILK